MFALLSKSRKLGLDIDVQLQLFDSLVVPIATYGCEVWGFRNLAVLEKLQLQFCKYILKINRSTCTVMVLGELGRLPIEYVVSCKMLGFWYRLVTGHSNKISCILYKLLVNLEKQNVYSFDWLSHIKRILANCGMENVWDEPNIIFSMSVQQFKFVYKQKLKIYFTNKWVLSMNDYSKCSLYRNSKVDLVMEKYMLYLSEPYRSMLLKFRISNHLLPIEKGRHFDIKRSERKCELCDLNDVGDEYHYVCCCPKFNNIRKKLVPSKYYKNASVYKFCELMSCESKKQCLRNARLINCIMKEFRK